MSEHSYIACDLGAESGRVMLGHLKDGKLTLEEIHRFSNGPVRIQGSMRWNVIGIFSELKIGLKRIAEQKVAVESVSVDSWGVDYVWFNERQPMLALPYHYRDPRTDAAYENAIARATKDVIFRNTGIQFMSLNTLYQFVDDMENNADIIALADSFLNIADYLNFLLSGVARAEESLASTTQIYDPTRRAWSDEIIAIFGFPKNAFPQIVPSGTKLGPLQQATADETGLARVEVVATCSHDTGAAVAAVPAVGDDWAYLSSGTWSLIGVELPQPLINAEIQAHNYTNEAGFGGTTRFLKNIVGLWIIQECRRTWLAEGRKIEYVEFDRLADEAEPLRSIINPNAARFLKADNMPAKIRSFCQETNQPVPQTPGEFARCIYESLALLYRQSLEEMEKLTGKSIRVLHIVGGGSKSSQLNQYSASATGRTVVAGPVEATAIGNLLIQAIALGHLDSLAALRQTVQGSFQVTTYQPQESRQWQDAIERFRNLATVD